MMQARRASSSIRLEHRTHNPQVQGSNPWRPTPMQLFSVLPGRRRRTGHATVKRGGLLMPDDTKYTPYESLEELLDDWLADNPESSMQRVQAEMRRSLERLKAALEKQRGHSLSKQEFKTLVAKRQQLRKSPNSPQAFDEWTKELERESNKMMAGLRALS